MRFFLKSNNGKPYRLTIRGWAVINKFEALKTRPLEKFAETVFNMCKNETLESFTENLKDEFPEKYEGALQISNNTPSK